MRSVNKKIIFSAGGTGGHLFPAQRVAQDLQSSCEILFVGAKLGTSPFFDRSQFNFSEISSATFSLKNPLKIVKSLFLIVKGFFQSLHILKTFTPDCVVGFGSYYSLPMLMAAWIKRVPILLHEQNTIPGKVNRLFAPYAKKVAITFPETKNYLKGNLIQVAFPLKKYSSGCLGITKERLTLLIFGGSQGSAALNHLILEAVPELSQKLPPFQILHFTGTEEMALEARKVWSEYGIPHYVRPFEKEMGSALKLADLAIVRAGAATLAELIFFNLPALLIPFPHATENHQIHNGRYFVQEVQGGEMCLEQELKGSKLAQEIFLLEKDRFQKRKNIQEYKNKRVWIEFSEVILNE